MGNSVEVVKEVGKIAQEFAAWAGNPLPHTIHVDALVLEMEASAQSQK